MKNTGPTVAPRENPLIPFAMMKRMYAGMVESRLLEAWLAKREPGIKVLRVSEGEEACRAAVLSGLEAGDLVSDITGGVSSAWLRGAKLGEIMSGQVSGHFAGLLPEFAKTSQRLAMAIGAAVSVKQAAAKQVVVVFIEAAMKKALRRQILQMAARLELPVLFVVLPEEASGKGISAAATREGVPGIPVEASDVIAICRVAQESILRARAGGGPALLECIRLADDQGSIDPIAAIGKTLLRVGACDQAWLDGIAPAFRVRLKAFKHERPA